MAKRTKFSKFRSLYGVIENLLDTYTHEGVVEILAESHDLELSVSTLRSYLYRYKKQSKELSVATDKSNIKVKHNVAEQNLPSSQDSDSQDDKEIDYDALLEQFKNKHQTKSLLDK